MFDLRNFVGKLFGFDKDIKYLSDINTKLSLDISELQGRMQAVLDSNSAAEAKLVSLQAVVDAFNREKALEYLITNKIPKAPRHYVRHETDADYSVDVRNFFMINDDTIPTVVGATNDDKALAGLRLVRSIVNYTSDDSASTYKSSEYWAYAYQTLFHKAGDCEDGAILLSNVLVKSGIPYYRVRVCAGSVNGGGHAYCVYCRETDNEWVVLDWCYWPNDLPVVQRKPHRQEPNYASADGQYYVWFSWDLKNVYAKEVLPDVARKDFE